jgi:hypothetical protein
MNYPLQQPNQNPHDPWQRAPQAIIVSPPRSGGIRRFFSCLVFVIIAAAIGYAVLHPSILSRLALPALGVKAKGPATNDTAWWTGTWRNVDGNDVPALQVQCSDDSVSGQLVLEFQPRYHVSLPVLGGEASGDTFLFCVDNILAQPNAYQPVSNAVPPLWYLLVLRDPKHAALYRLQNPPSNLSLTRPTDASRGPVYHPVRPDANVPPLAILTQEPPTNKDIPPAPEKEHSPLVKKPNP